MTGRPLREEQRAGALTITGQAFGLAAEAAPGEPEAETSPAAPAEAAPILTAHRLGDALHHLGHAAHRMKAARDATGDLRAHHGEHLARHLGDALGAARDLTGNLRAHYPAEGAELGAVKESVGLAKAVSEDAKAATTAHLLETTLHELTHGHRHALAMTAGTPEAEWSFNADHAAKHLDGAAEHAGKLRDHLADNYPDEAKWLGPAPVPAGEGDGKPQHARYDKSGGETITAQLANRGYELNPRSGMISLDLPPGIITPLPGGVSDHHVTVVYLGPDVDDRAFAEACRRAQAAAAQVPGPLVGMVGGIGTFPPSAGSDGKVPVWAGVTLPGAERLRSALEDLSASEHKDWKPHVTVTYADPGDPLPPPVPSMQILVSHLSVHRGDDEVVRYPIGGDPAGAIGAQVADGETITGQAGDLAAPKGSARPAPAGSATAQLAGETITGQFLLTGDGHGHHIPGTPFDWRHPWVPLTPVAAKAHFRGNVPGSWHQESASRAGGLQRAASESGLTDAAFMLGQARLSADKHDPEEAARYAKMAASYVRDAADKGTINSERERELHNGISALHARLAGSPLPDPETYRQEARKAAVEAEAAVKSFAAKAHAVVPDMLGGGRSDWNGKVTLFNARDKPSVAAYMGWDGTMGFQRELAAQLAGSTKGAKVADPVAAFMPHIDVLHELIHSIVPAGGEPSEWKALPAGHRAALSAFSHMDKDNPSGGAVPTLHTLADARERDSGISQDTIDDLVRRGLLARSATTSSTWNPQTGQSTPPVHSWRLTAAGRDVLPVAAQTHDMHKDAYRDPQNAAIEEGFTELGTVHHAPEFLAQMGVGDQETGMISVTAAGHPREAFDKADLAARKDEIAKLAAQANETASVSAEFQLRLAAREMGKAAPDVGSVIDHLSKAHLAAKGEALKAGIWQSMSALNLAPSKLRQATVTEYAKRLRDPDRIAKGDAWGHYGWQTAAAQQWVLDAAKAEGKGKKSPRVRELADEINREGVGGKAPAMARQVIRAAGADPDKLQGAPFEALVKRIRYNWAQGPDEAKTSPWAMAMAAVRDYDSGH